MRLGALQARLQATEPTRKTTRANIQTRLPPNRPCAQPANGIAMPRASRKAVLTHATFSVQLATYYSETGTTPQQLREQVLGDRGRTMDVIMDRAVARGEVDPTRLTPRLVTLPVDLIRHEALMTLGPVSEATILEVVDDIFLPLVTGA
jgi:hypothetical protein